MTTPIQHIKTAYEALELAKTHTSPLALDYAVYEDALSHRDEVLAALKFLADKLEGEEDVERVALALAKASGIDDWFKATDEFKDEAKAAINAYLGKE